MKNRYQISTQAMLRQFQKISLKPGDILVVRDVETLRYLSQVKVPGLDSVIPLIFAPNGVDKLTKHDLLNLLEQLEQRIEPPNYAESPTAPL